MLSDILENTLKASSSWGSSIRSHYISNVTFRVANGGNRGDLKASNELQSTLLTLFPLNN